MTQRWKHETSERSDWVAPRNLSMKLEPRDFVSLMATERDTDAANDLMSQAVDIVEATADPDPWILEIRRARECGLVSAMSADSLIEEFARSAVMPLTVRHPVLAGLMARLTDIEREYGLEKGDHWEDNDGPPEYQALCDQCKAAMRRLTRDVLIRNGERKIAEFLADDEEDEFWFAHALLFRIDRR